jgi:SAM-dependent methyltransferase
LRRASRETAGAGPNAGGLFAQSTGIVDALSGAGYGAESGFRPSHRLNHAIQPTRPYFYVSRMSVAAGVAWALHSWVMPHPSWNESYAAGELPWDTGEPEPLLVEFVAARRIQPSRTLEIGAGTGTNSLYLAERAFDVLGIDVAPLAVERATAKLNGRALRCRFAASDFLAAAPVEGPFGFVFDRGCFHVFDEPDERARFAAQVAAILAPGALWLSLIGSTECAPRKMGLPRRSATEITLAIEPALEIVELRAAEFRGHGAPAWFCLSRQRKIPAQPSTRHD